MIGKQIIGYVLLFKLKGIDSKNVRHKNDDSCRRTKDFRRLSPKKNHLKSHRIEKKIFQRRAFLRNVSNADQTVKYHPSKEGIKGRRAKKKKKKKKRKTRIGKFEIFDRASILRIEI